MVNALAIAGGSVLGVIFKNSVFKKYNSTIMHALGLAVLLIGLKSALKAENILLVISSLALGSLIGEFLGIEEKLEKMGMWFEKKFARNSEGIAEGFVTASLVYCVGSMAIIGSLESGLTGNHQTLYAKSVIDGISSIIFASSMGAGVLLSSISVFVYQGFITIASSSVKEFLIPSVVSEMSAIGGLLIAAIGIKMMEIKTIKIGNMLPSIIIPLFYYLITLLF